MALTITRDLWQQARAHAESTYPEECCGLLLGASSAGAREVAAIFPMRNAAPARHNRFVFDPHQHLAAERAARARGFDVVGYYHSHPDHPAQPSAYDLDHAAWPGTSYLIIAVADGHATEANSFELAPDRSRFLDEPIAIQD